MEVTGVLGIDAGLGGLWSPAAFAGVVDYDTWEAELLEDADIARHITAGAFVPVNIGSDGAFQVLARVGTASAAADLTARERRYLVVSSEPYLFVADGDAMISGLEHVGADADVGVRVPLGPGRWSVTVALIGWADEPGQKEADGRAAATALPDFTLLINPAGDGGRYRTAVETFDR